MTSDDFLSELRADWQRTPVDLEQMRRRAARHRRFAAFYHLFGVVGVVTAVVLGAGFAIEAAQLRDPLMAVAAAAFLVSVPLFVVELVEGRRDRRLRYDDTQRGVLLQARQQVRFSRRLLRGGRWSAMILASAAAIVMLLVLAGRAELEVALPIVSVWAAAALLVWTWQAWRAPRLDREAKRCDRLLAELDAAEDDVQGA